MTLRFSSLVVAAAVVVPTLCSTGDAAACGGCFIPPSSPSVVTGHRMALSISPVQTVLWDQIQYAGDPEDFAWVLPVKPGAVVEGSTDAFFETLEAFTVVQVQQASVDCGNSGPGCGAAQAEAAGAFDSGGGTVDVVHQGTVGPYETVTLATDTPGALNEWLADHGYNVDDATQPIIDAYVAEGFDFIALRLQPGQGIRQMTPVRIVTQGADPTLPLRMVAAGAGPEVGIVLYVISEGRWQTENFPAAKFPYELVSWDFDTDESNYGVLRERALAETGGRGWLTAYAQPDVLTRSFDPLTGAQGFLQTYFDQAFANSEIMETCAAETNIAGTDVVAKPSCTVDAAGVETCEPLPPNRIDARTLACATADDVAMALTGLHPDDVWVTRLEANLAREALDVDLRLTIADEQSPHSNVVPAKIAVNAESFCGSATPPVLRPPSERDLRDTGSLVALSACAMGLVAATVRRRRRATASRSA